MKRLAIGNFLSVGDQVVNIDYLAGINVVTGNNCDQDSRNGIGKSALFADALHFALFGSAARKITNSSVTNRQKSGRCKVELEFAVIDPNGTDDYILTRMLKPSRLYLSKNGQDISRNIRESTDEINNILGITPVVFKNCVLMSLNSTQTFMMQRKTDKRTFIEGILRLDVFSEMLAEVRRTILDAARTAEIQQTTVSERQSALERLEHQAAHQQQAKDQRIQELKQRAKDKITNLENLKQQAGAVPDIDVEQMSGNLEKLDAATLQLNEQINELQTAKGTISERSRALGEQLLSMTNQPTACPTCGRDFEESHDCDMEQQQQAVESDLNNCNDKLTAVHEQINQKIDLRNAVGEKIKHISQLIDTAETVINKASQAVTQINGIKSAIEDIHNDIKSVRDDHKQNESVIEEALNEVNEAKLALEAVTHELDKLELVKFIVSEDGVKSHIIKKMLKTFNERLAYYLKRLNANCVCSFNEYFEETILDEHGIETQYANFSQGEARRIDLAMLFTFQDVRRLQADTSINIAIYDELFDSSLDESGVKAVVDILRDRTTTYNECTYLITHREDAIRSLEEVNLIHLEKRNGITAIAQS